MFEQIQEFISRIFEDYEHASAARKKAMLALTAFIIVLPLGFMMRGCFRSSGSLPTEKIGVVPLEKQDANGDVWVLKLIEGQPLKEINQSVEPGPPLLVKTDCVVKDRDVSLGIVVTGKAGEKYVAGVMKNGQWQNAPSFKLLSETGQTMATGTFKYG